jgi:hypothetical protein
MRTNRGLAVLLQLTLTFATVPMPAFAQQTGAPPVSSQPTVPTPSAAAQPSNTPSSAAPNAPGSAVPTSSPPTPGPATQSTANPTPGSTPTTVEKCKPATLCSAYDWGARHPGCAGFFGILILVLIVLTIRLTWSSRAGAEGESYIGKLKSSFFFWLDLGYLMLLLVFAALYLQAWTNACPLLLGGLLPVAVPWFGAVGAVLISLEGIFAHGQRGWDNNYNYWHIGRPLFGAVLAIVAFFFYVLLVNSSGAVPAFLDDKLGSPKPKDFIIYYVVAFLVGYREETFRELIRRVTDMIFKPSPSSPDAPSATFKVQGSPRTTLDFGLVPLNDTRSITVEVVNAGKGTLIAPKATIDGGTAALFKIDNDKLTSGGDLKSGESRTLDAIFHPTATGPASANLVITGTNSTSGSRLPLSGHT